MSPEQIAEAEAFLADPDGEDCERFTSRYGRSLIEIAKAHWNTRAEGPAPVSAPLEREGVAEPLVAMLSEAVRFASWAAGEGICPVEGQPARAPEDFLMEYSDATGEEEWETMGDRLRAILALSQQDQGGLTTPAVLGEPSADALRSGGEDAVGAAERDVGRYIYQRIEALMDANTVAGTKEDAELDYLATVVAAVEEYGSEHCAGEDLSVFREPQEGVSAPLVGSDFSVSQSQPCTNGSPDPVLTLPQHSDGEALAYFETFVKRKDEMDRMGYGLRAEEWPGFVSVMRAALAAAPSEPS